MTDNNLIKAALFDLEALCRSKNCLFGEMIRRLTPGDWLVGSAGILKNLRDRNAKLALCSSSKTAHSILARLKGEDFFDVVVDGNDITRTKPDPQIFLLAAERLGVKPTECVVFEDAESGIEAAKRAK